MVHTVKQMEQMSHVKGLTYLIRAERTILFSLFFFPVAFLALICS